MAAMLETPSRIWRRIEAVQDQDMPSLPSVPAFEDSADAESLTSQVLLQDSDEHTDDDNGFHGISSPRHSTPAASQFTSTICALPSTNSAARLANSMASRKPSLSFVASYGTGSRSSRHGNINISKMPGNPRINIASESTELSISDRSGFEEESKSSVPDIYLPPEDGVEELEGEVFSLTDALQPVSRTSSPPSFSVDTLEEGGTAKKMYDYSVSLRSEPKPSPFNKYQNVAIRRTAARARTPSLTHTLSSPTTSTNSTPRSSPSIPQSQSHSASSVSAGRTSSSGPIAASPAIGNFASESSVSGDDATNAPGVDSMDITDVHASPVRALDGPGSVSGEENTRGPGDSHVEKREQTFSSDGAPSKHPQFQGSPSESLDFTPTPAFPRPRARFKLPSSMNIEPPSTPAQDDNRERDYADLVTPYTRRRSFLLSVINSTARPRLKVGTPHPRHATSIAESTPGPSKESTPAEGTSLRAVLAGVTPRPPVSARRSSHSLAQTYVPSPTVSETESVAAYDADDHVSVISTTSSQDLTARPRANTSFDPSMGFGAGAAGHGVGRFNVGKLNNYLHVLNRRLQEENELLLERLKNFEEQQNEEGSPIQSVSSRRLSLGGTGSRRLSAGTVLNDVEEHPVAERWLEEKAELEEMIDSFKDEIARYMAEKEEVESALENEKRERERDKERWKERMAEAEAGVSELVVRLEEKLESAEKKAQELAQESEEQLKRFNEEIEVLRAENNLASERVEKAERALESGKDLGGALNEANGRLTQATSDLKNANRQIQELEKEVMDADARIDELETKRNKDQELISNLEEEAHFKAEELATERARARELESQNQGLDKECRELKSYADELEENAQAAADRIESLEQDITDAGNTIKRLEVNEREARQRISQFEEEAVKMQEVNAQMEEALEEAEKKMLEDEEALVRLRSELTALGREKQRLMSNTSHSISTVDTAGTTQAELEALEADLDEAHKEIGRLNALIAQSPARKAMDMAKDAKIELLEREKEELLERNKALRTTMNDITTPHKSINASGISPIHRHVLSMSIRAPRTPGGPLKELSWLNNTMGDPSVTPLLAEINRLQQELDRANESIDDKIDKLEDAGLGVVGLTRKLEDARAKIIVLEDEIARLKRTEERRSRRLERIRCQKCKSKVDIHRIFHEEESLLDASKDHFLSQTSTSSTGTREALHQNLQSLNEELANLKRQWQEEKRQLVNEKVVLQDATNRLSAQVKEEARRLAETERNAEKKRISVENELEHTRKTIQELEGELKSERSRLRGLDAQQSRIQRDRDELLNQLKRTESDMEDVKNQLHKFKQENNHLEKELRENVTVEQKARMLEKKVAENQKTIESLRQERSSLSNDFKDLQRRYTEASERAGRLKKEYAASSNSHEHRRHQLDIHLLEIEDLKRALESQHTKMQQADEEKERIMAEKNDVAKTIAVLEADLRRVRRDAESFGRDLKALKLEKEKTEAKYKDEIAKLERSKKQAQTQLKLANEELGFHKEQALKTKNHVCAADSHQLSALRLQHNKECKGLIVQIRYLKAKFTRETSFRNDLGYQKQYLLVLLSQFEKSEQKVLASIARIGFPIALSKPRKSNKFKSVGFLIIFLSRARRASGAWREHNASKQAVAAALDDVRRRRAVTGIS